MLWPRYDRWKARELGQAGATRYRMTEWWRDVGTGDGRAREQCIGLGLIVGGLIVVLVPWAWIRHAVIAGVCLFALGLAIRYLRWAFGAR